MIPVYKILASLILFAIGGVILAVSLWFKTDAGREFKRRQAEKKDGE